MMYIFLMTAFAVPVQIMQQGRILDSDGTPLEGNQFLRFAIYDEQQGGSPLWEESILLNITNGYYSVELGTNPLLALESELLLTGGLYLEIDVNNTILEPRQSLGSVPYARVSQIAESLEGGNVNATQIAVSDQIVVDGDGNWMGQPITPQWSNIQGIPSGFGDGVDNDTQLSANDVVGIIEGTSSLHLHADTTIDGEAIQRGDDKDSLADISCVDEGMILTYIGGFWDCGYDMVLDSADVIGFVEGQTDLILHLSSSSTVNGDVIQTGTDQDTLAGITCSAGEILVYNINTSNWDCGTDTDTNLTAQEVKEMIESTAVNLAAGSQVDSADILTTASTLSVEWSNITNVPSALSDGDDSDTLDTLNCTEGQVAIKSASGWECKNFTTLLDNDNDGVMAWEDCDDDDQSKPANDADCDGVLTADDCNDSDAETTENDGTTAACALSSCKAILDAGFSTGDGLYYINPNNVTAFQVTCDMTTNSGGWTIIPESTSYTYKIYTEAEFEQTYTYTLTTTQINAIKSVSTEGFQDYQCQTVGVGSQYNLRGWDSNIFGVSGSCWAINNSDYKSSSGTYTSMTQIPLLSWFSVDCGDPSEGCQHNVDNAYFR